MEFGRVRRAGAALALGLLLVPPAGAGDGREWVLGNKQSLDESVEVAQPTQVRIDVPGSVAVVPSSGDRIRLTARFEGRQSQARLQLAEADGVLTLKGKLEKLSGAAAAADEAAAPDGSRPRGPGLGARLWRGIKQLVLGRDFVALQELYDDPRTGSRASITIEGRGLSITEVAPLLALMRNLKVTLEVPPALLRSLEIRNQGDVSVSGFGSSALEGLAVRSGGGYRTSIANVLSGAPVTIELESGRIELTGIQAPSVAAKTSGGYGIQARQVTGALRLDAGSGAIEVASVDGDVTTRTSGGYDTRIEDIQGDVIATSGSGRMEIARVQGSVFCESAGGYGARVRDVSGNAGVYPGSGKIEADRIGGSLQARTSGGYGAVVREVRGGVSIDVDSGPLEIADCAGGVYARTSGGYQTRLERNEGDIDAQAGSGPIVASNNRGNLSARTTSYPVSVQGQSGGYVQARTTASDITLANPSALGEEAKTGRAYSVRGLTRPMGSQEFPALQAPGEPPLAATCRRDFETR